MWIDRQTREEAIAVIIESLDGLGRPDLSNRYWSAADAPFVELDAEQVRELASTILDDVLVVIE